VDAIDFHHSDQGDDAITWMRTTDGMYSLHS
jgi:hypothetical protein